MSDVPTPCSVEAAKTADWLSLSEMETPIKYYCRGLWALTKKTTPMVPAKTPTAAGDAATTMSFWTPGSSERELMHKLTSLEADLREETEELAKLLSANHEDRTPVAAKGSKGDTGESLSQQVVAEILQLQSRLGESEKQVSELQQALHEAQSQVKSFDTGRAVTEEMMEKTTAELRTLQSAYASIEEELAQKSSLVEESNEKLLLEENKATEMMKQVELITEKCDAMTREKEELVHDRDRIKRDLDAALSQVSCMAQEKSKSGDFFGSSETEVVALRADIKSRNEEIAAAKEKAEKVEHELKEAKESLDEKARDVEKAVSECKSLGEMLKTFEVEKETLQGQIKAAQDKVGALSIENAQLSSKIDESARRLEEEGAKNDHLAKTIDELQQEKSRWEHEVRVVKATVAQQERAVPSFADAAERGRVQEELANRKAELAKSTVRIKALENKVKEMQEAALEMNALKESIKNLETENRQYEAEHKELLQKLESLSNGNGHVAVTEADERLTELEAALQDMEAQSLQAKEEAQTHQMARATLELRIGQLEKEILEVKGRVEEFDELDLPTKAEKKIESPHASEKRTNRRKNKKKNQKTHDTPLQGSKSSVNLRLKAEDPLSAPFGSRIKWLLFAIPVLMSVGMGTTALLCGMTDYPPESTGYAGVMCSFTWDALDFHNTKMLRKEMDQLTTIAKELEADNRRLDAEHIGCKESVDQIRKSVDSEKVNFIQEIQLFKNEAQLEKDKMRRQFAAEKHALTTEIERLKKNLQEHGSNCSA